MMDSPAEHEKAYTRAVENFNSLRAFVPRFRESKVYMRRRETLTPSIATVIGPLSSTLVTMRDQAVCALLNKATNTHAAIKVLTDAGHGDDADALARVLLENVSILRWLLLDRIYRLDVFCISDALFRRRYLELIEKHYKHKPDLVQRARDDFSADEQRVAAFFGNTIHKWAQALRPDGPEHVALEAMFSELAGGERDSHTSNVEYELIYFMLSGYVHSTSTVMRSFGGLKREPFFTLEVGPHSTRRNEALGGANIFFWRGLRAGSEYLGLERLVEDLDAFFDTMKEPAQAAAEALTTDTEAPD